jgi:hemin uptake protein HemP
MTTPKPPQPVNTGPSHTSPAAGLAPRTVDSQELLGANGVLYIRHQNEVYRLQTTRFGKLILTK